jgi:MHS family proline/betaine transporter-like MFS transporter
MRSASVYSRLAGIVGNILEHYDNALFGLLAPFIAPLFFQQQDPVTALVLTYGMLPLGMLGRPVGSLFFGWIGDRWGRRQALFYSLLGMSVVTVSIGFLPTYSQVGVLAPGLLFCGRLLQSFFAAGESTGGAIYVLEQTGEKKRGFISSLYDASSIVGILIGSGLVTLFSSMGTIEHMWRWLFWAGGLTAVFGLFLRMRTEDSKEFVRSTGFIQGLKDQKRALFSLVIASGFSYTTYAFPFVLMNSFVPLVTSISKAEAMKVNTALLVVDMFLLPFFGILANRFGKERVMLFGCVGSAVTALPLFYMLGSASTMGMVIATRLIIVVFGVAFAAPYHAWAIERVPSQSRYTVLSLGHALGSQLIGAPSSAVCLWLYKQMGWNVAPGFYLLFVALGATVVLVRFKGARDRHFSYANASEK